MWSIKNVELDNTVAVPIFNDFCVSLLCCFFAFCFSPIDGEKNLIQHVTYYELFSFQAKINNCLL